MKLRHIHSLLYCIIYVLAALGIADILHTNLSKNNAIRRLRAQYTTRPEDKKMILTKSRMCPLITNTVTKVNADPRCLVSYQFAGKDTSGLRLNEKKN